MMVSFIRDMARPPQISVSRDRVIVDFLDAKTADSANAFIDMLRVLAWLNGDLLIEKLGHLLDSIPQLGEPMADAARTRALQALDQQLLGAERAEEMVIANLETEGVAFARREDASPMAILGLRPIRKMAAVEAAA
jgi:hypothetical protein